MENSNTSAVKTSTTTAWLLVGVSTIGMLIFAGMYFSAPKVQSHEVVREVPKEVVRQVEVPAQIPDDYRVAMKLCQNMTNATVVGKSQVLFGMQDVRVEYTVDDVYKGLLTQEEVKAKFELTLRRNSVTINPNSKNVITLDLNGFYQNDQQAVISFTLNTAVSELLFIFRDGRCHIAKSIIWVNPSYGAVGKQNAGDLLSGVEQAAEIFANDFLSANPKK